MIFIGPVLIMVVWSFILICVIDIKVDEIVADIKIIKDTAVQHAKALIDKSD